MTPAEAGIALVRAFGKGARFEVIDREHVSICDGHGSDKRITVRLYDGQAHAIAACLTACHAEGLAAIEGEGVAAKDV